MQKFLFAFATSMVALTGSASAAIVCNEDGDCWRVKERYEYRPEFGVRVFNDDWRWKDAERSRYRWVEARPGRGYYRKGVWIGF